MKGTKFAFAVMMFYAAVAAAQVRLTLDDPSHARKPSPEGPVRGPVLGYVFNAELGRLQPIRGIPGSAFEDTGAGLEAAVSLAEVSPRQDFALMVAAGSREILLADLTHETPAVRSIPGALPGADRIVISPSGTSAALYSRSANAVQILTGLPDAPSIAAREMNLSGDPEPITAMAVSDDAGVLLAATGAGVFAVGPRTAPRLLYPVRQVSSISFVAGSHDALVAAYEDNRVLLIHDAAGAANTEVLAGETDGVSGPIAVAASRDGRRAFAVNVRTGTVLAIPLTPGRPAVIECRCRPSRLQRLAGQDVFLLSEPRLPLFVLDAGAADVRITVVSSDVPVKGGR